MAVFSRLFGQRHQPPAVHDFADDYVYPLHLQDFNFRKLIMACTMRFDHVLDADKLFDGLTRLFEMGDWKKLGGRLRQNADGKLEIHVPKQYSAERPAVTFSRHDLSSTPIASHHLAGKLPVPTERTSVQPNPYSLIDLGVRPDIPKTIGEMIGKDLPQISLHVTSFQDATLVGISWPHSAMGSQGFKHLVHAWSLVVGSKDKQVPRFLGASHDVLFDIEDSEKEESREDLIFQKHRLYGFGLLLFLLRFVWNSLWNSPVDVKSVFFPQKALSQLQAACRQEITDTSEAKTEAIDAQATLLAWFARIAASATSESTPITIITIFDARQQLSAVLDQAGVYVQNMVCYTFSFLSGRIARGGLGPLVREHTSHCREQSTEQQCLSFLRMYRRAAQERNAFKPFYGPASAHAIVCNSLVNADLIRTVDFGAAALHRRKAAGGAPPGAMTCFYYHIMNNRLGGGPDCVYLLGKDHGENLWVTAALPRRTWGRIEAELEKYK